MPDKTKRTKDGTSRPQTKPSRPHTYKESEKRIQTKHDNKKKIEQAAWGVFSTKGFDASTSRDIISASGVSPGTFYNYYGDKYNIFQVLLASLVERIRIASHDARIGESAIGDQLRVSFQVFLELMSSLPQGREFCQRNQHHIREILYKEGIISGILSDMHDDYQTGIATGLQPDQEILIVRLIFAVGLEAVLFLSSIDTPDARWVSDISSKFALFGLSSWIASPPSPSTDLSS